MSDPFLPEPSGREPSSLELATARDPRLGVATAVTVRSEGGGQDAAVTVVVSYRLRRWGPDGVERPVLQVEMRGRRLQGMLADGDLVQAPAPLPPTGTVRLETVTNLTTGSEVSLPDPKAPAGCRIAFLAVAGLMLLAIIAIAIVVLSQSF